MKRSEINKALKDMEQMVKACGFSLPPFCRFTPEEWRKKGHEYDEIRDNMLGWDITDFGLGAFDRTGFSLITLRNGNVKLQDLYCLVKFPCATTIRKTTAFISQLAVFPKSKKTSPHTASFATNTRRLSNCA